MAALFLLLVGQAQITVLDGSSMLAVAQSLVHHGSLNVPPELGVPGEDGLFYSKYGLLLPLLSVVPVALVQPIGVADRPRRPARGGGRRLAHARDRRRARRGAVPPRAQAGRAASGGGARRGRHRARHVPAALRPRLLHRAARRARPRGDGRARAGRPRARGGRRACLRRPRAPAVRRLRAGPVGVPRSTRRGLSGAGGRERRAVAPGAQPRELGAAPGDARPRAIAALRAILRTLAPLAIAAAITVAYNLVRFGGPLEFGYEPPTDPGFTTPLLHGTSGLLFSPEKSIVLFAPAIVLVPFALIGLWRARPATAALLAALFAGMFVLAATWHSWMGGWSWGPRLVIPGVAVLLAALGPWIGAHATRMRVAAALFALGFVDLAAGRHRPGRRAASQPRSERRRPADRPPGARAAGADAELARRRRRPRGTPRRLPALPRALAGGRRPAVRQHWISDRFAGNHRLARGPPAGRATAPRRAAPSLTSPTGRDRLANAIFPASATIE